MGKVVLSDYRISCIGLTNKRPLYGPAQSAHKACGHTVGSHAVKAYGAGTGLLQFPKYRCGIPAGEQTAVRLHGKGIHHSTRPFQLSGGEDGLGILGIQEGLSGQQVCAALSAITVETLTPIEAMNELYRLKKMLE